MRKRIRVGASVVRSTRWARAQRVRSYRQWSDEAETEFLDALAASANVTLACEEAGVGHTSVYRRRRDNAAFAIKWQAALEQGYARLEMELVRSAVDSLGSLSFDASRPIAAMGAETALKVLTLHRQSAKKPRRAPTNCSRQSRRLPAASPISPGRIRRTPLLPRTAATWTSSPAAP